MVNKISKHLEEPKKEVLAILKGYNREEIKEIIWSTEYDLDKLLVCQ